MKIRSLLPSAFGKFHRDHPIIFGDGLNIVRGDNEAGKSTLGAFILGMFYGFKKEGKTRISRSPEFDRFRPWSGNAYHGSMTYEDGGRVYRVERSFDPDAVRILDDITGEDLTREFAQDSRKEYDFAEQHLGMSQKEFRNTIWIGQLGSAQEPGLGTEIQGKLESMLEGGAEDVSLARALAALNEERAKLKSPRSTKARLDLVASEIDRLEKELAVAQVREEQVRDWLIEASDLSHEKAGLESDVDRGSKELRHARYRMLRGILELLSEMDQESAALRERIASLDWAGDLPDDAEGTYRSIESVQEGLKGRIAEVEGEIALLNDKREGILRTIEEYRAVEEAGVDEVAVSALHTKYLLAKAQAARGERGANEARKELRAVEQEGRTKNYPTEDLDEDVLRLVEDNQQNCLLAERENDRLDLEVERARTALSSITAAGGTTVIYAAALVVLGLAVVCTVMALPVSVPLFAVATLLFGFGIYRSRQAEKVRSAAEKALTDKEVEAEAQAVRVDEARKTLSASLQSIGARSVEELRGLARDISAYRARLAAVAERFDQVQKAWFEASAELSAVENNLLEVLRSSGTIKATDPVTDAAVSSLRRSLRELGAQKAAVRTLGERISEETSVLAEQRALLDAANVREAGLFAAAGVDSGADLEKKVLARKDLDESRRTLQETAARAAALLRGRDAADVRTEVERLSRELGDEGILGDALSDREYEDRRLAHDEYKARLSLVSQKLAAIERAIRLRGEEGQSAAAIEEELALQRSTEEELTLQHSALNLAHETLAALSAGIRREFAPALNNRVGEILVEMTGGRYTQVKVSPDLEMSVIHPDTNSQAAISSLSAGTLDQCYLALRVAIAEAITKKEDFPFFFDDSFTQYDDNRLEGALRILAELAKSHQILVFSCHGREEETASRMGISYSKVPL